MHGMFLKKTQTALGLKASILAQLGRLEEAQIFLAKYQEKRPEVKKNDYEKVARHHQGRFTLWSNQVRTAND